MTLQDHLREFTGTEHYYKHLFGMFYTDGVRYFAEEAGTYWFLDIVATEIRALGQPFYSIALKVADSKATIKVTDGNDTDLFEREIEFTDCPDGLYTFFFTDNVMMLTSEY